MPLVPLLLLCLLLPLTSSTPTVYITFGSNIPTHIQTRLSTYTSRLDLAHASLPSSITSIHVAFGNSSTSLAVIPPQQVDDLAPEGYLLRSTLHNSNELILACNGKATPDDNKHHDLNSYPAAFGVNRGALYGAYRLLHALGVRWLHPLEPLLPAPGKATLPRLEAPWNITSAPRWPVRGFHYHTEHPLELHELLNGFASVWGNGTVESWASMVPEYSAYLEWLVANGSNRLEWVLLWAADWQVFANSTLRQQRLAKLTALGHAWGLSIGADVPLGDLQQHGWPMVRNASEDKELQLQDIRDTIDWMVDAGFDYLSTESGLSEFTHPSDLQMLAWMNEATAHCAERGLEIFIKCHCSTGQVCEHFDDPFTGKPLNFNFLPIEADPRLGLLAHTVQNFAFDDPSPTYGNVNMSYMLTFLEQNLGKRKVIYHGESAYWVNFDVDVPLALPSYVMARLKDLRSIAAHENAVGVKMQGQINFASGFEWSYWLNDLVTARVAWDPMLHYADEYDALRAILADVFGDAAFGSAAANSTVDLLQDTIKFQRDVFINGEVDGKRPSNITARNGQAYLVGLDTWTDLQVLYMQGGLSIPRRLGLSQLASGHVDPTLSFNDLKPLLATQVDALDHLATRACALNSTTTSLAALYLSELCDTWHITALRGRQVRALYEVAASGNSNTTALNEALSMLKQAAAVVARRESAYRFPVPRIAGWRDNPTSYGFGYLWTVHRLYYWKRDQGKAMLDPAEAASPCYLNIINMIDFLVGQNVFTNVTQAIHDWASAHGVYPSLFDCFGKPESDPLEKR